MFLGHLRTVSIVAGAVLLLALLLVKTQSIDYPAHDRFNSDLRRLKELDATINQDVLKARYNLLTYYDPLINQLAEVKELQSDLKKLGSGAKEGQQDVLEALDAYASMSAHKEQLIERFKSQNAILRNSLRYFPIVAAELAQKVRSRPGGATAAAQLDDLLRSVLVYNLHGEDGLASRIVAQRDALEKAGVNSGDGAEQNLKTVLTTQRPF